MSRTVVSPAGMALAGATVALALLTLAGCGSLAGPGAAAGSAGAGSGAGSGPGSSASAAAADSPPAADSASPSGSASASASGTAVAACAPSGLRIRLDPASAGVAAGSSYVALDFTNTSGRACALSGYPAVAFTSGVSGQQIGTEAASDMAVPATTVRLAPGGVAHAWLQVLDAANYPAAQCKPVTAAGLRVVAPGSQSSSYLPHSVPACKKALHGSPILTVHPVQPGQARRGTAAG